jgi:hypothetical protein
MYEVKSMVKKPLLQPMPNIENLSMKLIGVALVMVIVRKNFDVSFMDLTWEIGLELCVWVAIFFTVGMESQRYNHR